MAVFVWVTVILWCKMVWQLVLVLQHVGVEERPRRDTRNILRSARKPPIAHVVFGNTGVLVRTIDVVVGHRPDREHADSLIDTLGKEVPDEHLSERDDICRSFAIGSLAIVSCLDALLLTSQDR